MNITQESIDKLNAIVTVEIKKEDYLEKVEAELKKFQKKAQMPGFRAGKVPMSLVKKLYIGSVLADQINNIASEGLFKFIEENKIEILGNPMINLEKTPVFEWTDDRDYTFCYDLGLAPEVPAGILDVKKAEYSKIAVDTKDLDKQIEGLRRRYGKFDRPEVSEDGDMIWGKIVELDEAGNEKEGGISNFASIAIDTIKNKKDRKPFIGVKKEENVDFIPTDIFSSDVDIAAMLGIQKEAVAEMKSTFRMNVQNINRVELAEMNEEFFKQALGSEEITTEEQFKSAMQAEMEKVYAQNSDIKFFNDVRAMIIENSNIELPDTFLKRWIQTSSEGKITEEQVETEYSQYTDSLKWQLIENKIIRDNDIKVEPTEATAYMKEMIADQLKKYYGKMNPSEEELDDIVKRMMQDKDSIKRTYDELFNKKLIEFFKSNVTYKTKEVSYEKFIEEAKK